MLAIYTITIILVLLGFVSKRRFGLPCLGLVAGSIISLNWANYVTALLQTQGIRLLSPPLGVVVGIGLILLPGLLLLIVGPRYRKQIARLGSGLVVAILALTLMVSALVRYFPGTVADNPLLITINRLQPFIVVFIVILAIIDVIHTHLPHKKRSIH